MGKLGTYLENFAFKSFNFSGRATRMEFWFVMFVVWAIILVLLRNDLMMIWDMLSERKKPPLNPLAYVSVVVLLLTWPARLSLTVRRLHDSGKSGLWAKLPYICVWTSITMSLGLASAFLTAGVNSGNGIAEGMLMGVMSIAMSAGSGNLWDVIFGMVAGANAIGWDGLTEMIGLSSTPASSFATTGTIDTVGAFGQNQQGAEAVMKLGAIIMLAVPFISGFMHLVFMLLPSNRGDNRFGQPETLMQTGGLKMDPSNNPLAGYAHLYEKSDAQKAADQARAKEEIKTLYQQRVLGKQ